MANGSDEQASRPPAEPPCSCRMRGALTANQVRRQPETRSCAHRLRNESRAARPSPVGYTKTDAASKSAWCQIDLCAQPGSKAKQLLAHDPIDQRRQIPGRCTHVAADHVYPADPRLCAFRL